MRHPRRLRAALLAVLSALLLAGLTPVAADAAGTGSVTFTGVDSATGAPVTTFCAEVVTAAFDRVAFDCTATGTLRLSGIPAGQDYTSSVSTTLTVYSPYAWVANNRPFRVGASLTARFTAAAALTGTARYTDGTTVSYQQVTVWKIVPGAEPVERTSVYTDVSGRWSARVPGGRYALSYVVDGGDPQYGGGAASLATAPVTRLVTRQVATVDDVLQGSGGGMAAGTVHGVVRWADTGLPAAGLCVRVDAVADGPFNFDAIPSCAGNYVGVTDAAGRYSVVAPAGADVYVASNPSTLGYAAGWSHVALPSGASVTAPPISLPRAGSLTGRVVDRTTGTPIAGLCVSADAGRTSRGVGRGTCTDAAGRFRIDAVTAGQVTVFVNGDADHVELWYGSATTQASARLFTVVADQNTQAGTLGLPHGGVVRGRVTDAAGTPLAGVTVSVGGGYPARVGDGGRYNAVTGADGRYVMRNVQQQDAPLYTWAFRSTFGWAWTDGVGDPADAATVAIRWDTTTTYNPVVQPQAVLKVTLTGTGTTTEYTLLDAQTVSGAWTGSPQDRIGDGVATVKNLPTSTVKLRAQLPGGREVWYGGTSAATATPISVTSGRTTAITFDVSG